jgi:hypothetical protein
MTGPNPSVAQSTPLLPPPSEEEARICSIGYPTCGNPGQSSGVTTGTTAHLATPIWRPLAGSGRCGATTNLAGNGYQDVWELFTMPPVKAAG